MIAEIFGLIALASVCAATLIKSVNKNERLVISENGKAVRVSGPGIVIVWTGLQSSQKVDVRTQSLPLPDVKLDAKQSSVVSGKFEFKVIDPLKAVSTMNARNAATQIVQSVLVAVIQKATMEECLRHKFVLEREIMDLANEQTKKVGVKISAISLNDFKRHRRLMSELAGILGVLASDITVQLAGLSSAQVADSTSTIEACDPLYRITHDSD